MKFDVWKRAKSVQDEFQKSLDQLVDIFNKIAATSGSDQEKYNFRMNNFQNSYAYEKFVVSSVKRMVTPLAIGNMSTWRNAARKATKSKSLYSILMGEMNKGLKNDIDAQVIENAALIRTLPNDVAQKVAFDIKDMALSGLRSSTIADIISKKTDEHGRASAKLIARTEVSKTTTALTRSRSEALNLHWYVWRTSMDGNRVRKSHRLMEGLLVSWREPPSPEQLVGEKSEGHYHAGNVWNCRCYPEPLIEVDDVKWPHRVYHNGRITMMSRKGFENIE